MVGDFVMVGDFAIPGKIVITIIIKSSLNFFVNINHLPFRHKQNAGGHHGAGGA